MRHVSQTHNNTCVQSLILVIFVPVSVTSYRHSLDWSQFGVWLFFSVTFMDLFFHPVTVSVCHVTLWPVLGAADLSCRGQDVPKRTFQRGLGWTTSPSDLNAQQGSSRVWTGRSSAGGAPPGGSSQGNGHPDSTLNIQRSFFGNWAEGGANIPAVCEERSYPGAWRATQGPVSCICHETRLAWVELPRPLPWHCCICFVCWWEGLKIRCFKWPVKIKRFVFVIHRWASISYLCKAPNKTVYIT